jgi:Zn-dependent hydrolases, including glyoxylases
MKIILIKLSVTTCYLIKAGENYLLIDTGYTEDWKLFCRKLKEANVSVSQISHILLTHHHDDHCGLLHLILAQNGNIRIIMSSLCKELIQKGQNDISHGGGLLNRRVAFLIRHKQQYVSLILHKKIQKENNLKFSPYFCRDCDIIVQDGVRFRDIGIPLEGVILETPGHTVDSMSVLFDDGDCFVGDAAADMLKFAGTKNCVIFICDMDTYYHSWEKLIDKGAQRIHPAHGRTFPVSQLRKNAWKNKAENLVQ